MGLLRGPVWWKAVTGRFTERRWKVEPKDAGTVFKLNKDGSGYAVLHSFFGSETDGFKPMAGLLAGSDGALYGTTDGGGDVPVVASDGTVFKINPDGSGYKLLHSFPDKPSDGPIPTVEPAGGS